MTTEAAENPFTRTDEAPERMRRQALAYLDAVAAHQEMQRVRTAAFEMFAPAHGERLLDAGCGAGEVARQLGARVGAGGSVIAVDLSEQTVSVARSRHDGTPVTYAVGDVTALDLPDGHVDGARCERVLQHVADPQAAVRELARVTRPGGRVCVVDSDTASAVWEGFDHMTEIMEGFAAARVHRTAGRAARGWLVGAGLRETAVLPVTLRFTSPADAAVVSPYFHRALLADRLPGDLVDRFLGSAERAAARGDFLFAFTMWIVQGRVPVR